MGFLAPKGPSHLFDATGVAGRFVADLTDMEYDGAFPGIIFARDGKIDGVFGLYDFRPGGQATMAGAGLNKKWFTRPNLRIAFGMAFAPSPHGFGLRRLNSFVTIDNVHSLEITKRLGLTQEGVMREASPDGQDIVVFGMLAHECPWWRADDSPIGLTDTKVQDFQPN